MVVPEAIGGGVFVDGGVKTVPTGTKGGGGGIGRITGCRGVSTQPIIKAPTAAPIKFPLISHCYAKNPLT